MDVCMELVDIWGGDEIGELMFEEEVEIREVKTVS